MRMIENVGVDKLAEELIKLNKEAGIMSYLSVIKLDNEKVIVTDLDMSKAAFPTGYYFSSKNGITNKHNTISGRYETIGVFTLTEFV